MKPGHLLVLLSAALCTSVYSSRFRKFFAGPKDNTMNWTDAQAFCRDRGTDLFTVHGRDNYTIVRENKTWYEAQKYCRDCRNNHIDLVSIWSKSHNAEVRKQGNITSPFWIGLICDSWEWTDGASSTFRDWDKTADFTQGNNCAYMKENHRWLTLGCQSNAIPVCSQENFVLIDEKLTWEDALNYCNDHHSGLLRIESKEDQEAVEEELRCKCVTWPVWLGLRQSRLFGFWIWANGMLVQWSNWEGGRQPQQPLSHACGAMVTTGEGEHKWRDQNCLYKHHFLCENKSNETR
ncbi:hypothetical protein JZ751_022219 [Albula glossodonta]|uniref:C-type lectin domain-containing protein n=1 Tax=Albula glossodonta TaxID=121402 RepID=A0A8T2NJN6_9TELE|nr:hypothetical protein JZ751_022219 [Albula glossodonta]